MLSDPISDMIIRIKNALLSEKDEVVVPKSNFKLSILNILKKLEFINDYKIERIDKKNVLKVFLKYHNNKPSIAHFKRLSKPGSRIYTKFQNIPNPLNGLGSVIISTPKGVMSGGEAKRKQLGGELICEIY